MKPNKLITISAILLIILLAIVFNTREVTAQALFQQPTSAIPTVTGTPEGVTATVNLDQQDPINVRSGPGVFYDIVGKMMPGQKAAVLGRTAGGDWVLINYFGGPNNQGWIYAPVVYISPGEIPIIEPPPTLTPVMTETINPTLAAQFITTPIPTRLATFTPAVSLVVPTYQDLSRTTFLGGIPMGLLIIVLGGAGALLAIFSLIRAR